MLPTICLTNLVSRRLYPIRPRIFLSRVLPLLQLQIILVARRGLLRFLRACLSTIYRAISRDMIYDLVSTHPITLPIYSSTSRETKGSEMTDEFGFVAEDGFTYEIKGARLFREAEYDRTLKGKAQSIMIYDPKVDYASPPYWESEGDPSKEEFVTVPAGYRVRVIAAPVIGATVTFTHG